MTLARGVAPYDLYSDPPRALRRGASPRRRGPVRAACTAPEERTP